MKLLIVDDEKLTREGILKSLPLEKLGIHHTFMADDGVHGLEIALKEKPDLILTDVRMPRMSGVEMAEEILKSLPNAIILFMSAYSDKEYLKAAIKLKAVSYVDKPLDMNELTEAGTAFSRNRPGRTGSCDRRTIKASCRGKFIFYCPDPGMSDANIGTFL